MGEQQKDEARRPVDKMKMVYIIFYWLGIGTLLPWNMFISVFAYWNYKLRTLETDVDPAAAGGEGETSLSDTAATNQTAAGQEQNDLQKAFGGYLAVASMVPNVTFLILNGFFGHRFKTQPRLLVSLVMVIVMFTFTSVMVKVDTDSWQRTFLLVTLASVVVININAAIFQGGILGVAGKFPPEYMGAVFSGQAVGGIFASGCNVVFLALGASEVDSALFCFVLSVVFLLTAFVAYMGATRSQFYQHYLGEKLKSDQEKTPEDSKLLDSAPAGCPAVPVKVQPVSVLLAISPYAVAVLLCFLVTLGCFPAITAQVVSTQEKGTVWRDTFMVPVACFLLFNIGDYVGRFLAGLIQWPKPSKAGSFIVLGFSIARFVFLPLFLFCNIRPGDDNVTPVLLESDAAYLVVMILFSVSNGYLGSICMMSAPQRVRGEEAATAANLMVAMLGLGLGLGAFLSNFFAKLI